MLMTFTSRTTGRRRQVAYEADEVPDYIAEGPEHAEAARRIRQQNEQNRQALVREMADSGYEPLVP